MAGRFSLLVLCLALLSGGCAAVSEERLARLESAVEDLQSQEVRLTILEDVVNSIVTEQRAATEGKVKAGETAGAPDLTYQPKGAASAAPAEPAAQAVPAAQGTQAVSAAPPTKPAAAPAQTRKTAAQAEKAYRTALTTLESGRPQAAMPLFTAFLREHPGHALAANAGYWLGECHYSLKQYDSAIIAFKDVVAQFPAHDKAAAAMLKAGYSYAQLGDAANARFYLEALLRDFPSSAPASLARTRLAAL